MDDKESLSIGWYGKIPSLGDFISRSLPANFIDIWDTWLQKAMATSREQLGEQWLDLYLTSPIWRFILMPDVCGNTNLWAGILMPSIDKVGRHFPLTLATEIVPHPQALSSLLSAQAWYSALEQAALASLDLNISPDDLDQSLAQLPPPIFCDESCSIDDHELSHWWQTCSLTGDSYKSLLLPTANSLIEVFTTVNQDVFSKISVGKSMWWRVDFETDQTQLHCFTGLPPESKFAILLNNIAR